MIRVVPDDGIPLEWFTPAERIVSRSSKIEDPDDISSVKLALATRGLYLSKDHDALCAAYGAAAHLIDHEEWLARLRAGSDAAELMRMLRGAGTLTYAVGHSAFSDARWIYDRLGDLSILLGAGAALLILQWLRQPPRTSMREGTAKTIELVATIGLKQREREEFLLSSRTWFAPRTLPNGADGTGGPPLKVLRDFGQPQALEAVRLFE